MALINCPECQKEISDKVKTCPHCGFPIIDEIVEPQKVEIASVHLKKMDKKKKKKIVVILASVLLMIAILVVVI